LLARSEAAQRAREAHPSHVSDTPPSRTRSVGVYFVGRNPKEALSNHHYAEAYYAIIRRDELNPGGPGFQPYKIFATDVEVQEDDLFEW
jgi:hypothetical protein